MTPHAVDGETGPGRVVTSFVGCLIEAGEEGVGVLVRGGCGLKEASCDFKFLVIVLMSNSTARQLTSMVLARASDNAVSSIAVGVAALSFSSGTGACALTLMSTRVDWVSVAVSGWTGSSSSSSSLSSSSSSSSSSISISLTRIKFLFFAGLGLGAITSRVKGDGGTRVGLGTGCSPVFACCNDGPPKWLRL